MHIVSLDKKGSNYIERFHRVLQIPSTMNDNFQDKPRERSLETYHGQRSKNLISYPKWSTNHSSVKNNNIDKQFSGMSNRRMQRIPLGKMIKNNFDCSLIILMFTKKPGHYRPISKGTLNNLTFYDNYTLVLLRFHQHANLLLPEKWEPNNKLIKNIFYKQNSVLWIDSYSFECEKQPTNYHVKLWHF